MTQDSHTSLHRLDSYLQNSRTLSSLQENERLWIRGRKVRKTEAPDRVFKNATHPILQVIHSVVTLAIKIFQSIARVLTGQSEEKSIQRVYDFTKELSELFNRDLSNPNMSEHLYALQKLGRVRALLTTALQVGLPRYKQTCLDGEAGLVRADEEIRCRRAEDVEAIIAEIATTTLPRLKNKIEEMEKKTVVVDQRNVSVLFQKLRKKGNFS